MEWQPAALPRLQISLGLLLFLFLLRGALAEVHYHQWNVTATSYTRLCHTKDILTINGQFPGPTLYVRRGDTVVINSFNHANYSVTIHWHGLKQPRNPWSDGTEFVTMCGVPPGKNFTYTLFFTTEEGTIWYHAHSEWTHATLYGAIVIYPKMGATYPFPKPDKEYVVTLGSDQRRRAGDTSPPSPFFTFFVSSSPLTAVRVQQRFGDFFNGQPGQSSGAS